MKNELKEVVNAWKESFDKLTENSRREYMATLEPGKPTPPRGQFYTGEAADKFKTRCDDLRQTAADIFAEERRKLSDALTEAPTTEAVNTIALLKNRENVTPAEIDALLDRYGDNVQTYRAIKDIAGSKGVKGIEEHAIDKQAQSLDNLERDVIGALMPTKENLRRANGAYNAMLCAIIDSTNFEENE